MSAPRIEPPPAAEYAPFYAGYVERATRSDPVATLRTQPAAIHASCGGLADAEALHRYAPEKWSVKEVIGHLIDAERVFSYRLFRIGRGDATPLSGFDEAAYVREAGFDARTMQDLVAEFEVVRNGTIRLVETIPPAAWTRQGVANGVPVSARALLHIVVGHVDHHLAILRDRYGISGSATASPE